MEYNRDSVSSDIQLARQMKTEESENQETLEEIVENEIEESGKKLRSQIYFSFRKQIFRGFRRRGRIRRRSEYKHGRRRIFN